MNYKAITTISLLCLIGYNCTAQSGSTSPNICDSVILIKPGDYIYSIRDDKTVDTTISVFETYMQKRSDGSFAIISGKEYETIMKNCPTKNDTSKGRIRKPNYRKIKKVLKQK